MTSVITVPALREELNSVSLFDIRWDLTDSTVGRPTYLAGHIPTAVFVDLERDLSASEGPGRHPLPDPDVFAGTLARLGVGVHSDVVVYDDVGGGLAARMWWMLQAIGHRGTARVLDGGFREWTEAGFDVSFDDVAPATTGHPRPSQGFRGVVDLTGVASDTNHVLIDGRAPERYQGEYEPVDATPGHIPGAINIPWTSLLTDRGTILAAPELRRRFEAAGADRQPVIVSCGSGVTSCFLALAMNIAGLPRPNLYVGSYSEWAGSGQPVASDPNRGT